MTTDDNLDFTQQHTPGPWTVNDFKKTAGLPERRRHKRIAIALPVILKNATGITRNVSASGAFFWVSGAYAIGEPISFGMGRKTEAGKSMLKCRGVVVRTEPRSDDVGVAVRVTGSAMEPVPSHLSGTDLFKSAHDQPYNITQRKDDALASAIETVDRWSSLLRNKALEACEELQGQGVLKWDIPSIADAITPHSRRVTVCSVTVVGLVSNQSRVFRHRGILGGSDRDLGLLHSNGEIDARKNAGEAGAGRQSEFVSWRNPHDGRIGRLELETYVANASQGDQKRGAAPLAKVVVRATSVRGDDPHQELHENCYQQKSYSDPTEAFEAFLALAVERAILINLD